MAKSYPDIGTFTSGQILTAATMNDVATNLDNNRSPAMCGLTRAATQSINNATDTLVQLDTSSFDTDGMGTTGAAAKITINTAGIYMVTCGASFAANTTGVRNISVWRNGSTGDRIIDVQGYVTSVTSANTVTASRAVSLAAGAYIDLRVYQTSGVALNLQAQTWLTATWLGATS